MREFFRIFFTLIYRVLVILWQSLRWLATHTYRALRWAMPPFLRGIRRFFGWMMANKYRRIAGLVVIGVAILYAGYWTLRFGRINGPTERNLGFAEWFSGDEAQRREMVTVVGKEPCPGAPFLLPTEGYIGLVYADPRLPYTEFRRHQGIDIFALGPPGTVPVYAAYDGYITRQTYWMSAVIQRVPDDPLNPGRQIWLYYAHMASEDGGTSYIVDQIPLGTEELFVEQGTLLGYMGNYAGNAPPIATHLHFSIVLDDGFGGYRNELDFNNTVDPSRYIGIPLNYVCAPDIPTCSETPLCPGAYHGAGGG